jgi:Domain of unknown function (DUF5666)
MSNNNFWRWCMAMAVALLVAVALPVQSGIEGVGRARGSITAFGSIFVNAVEYDTATALIEVDGQPATQADLRVGQVVDVDGTVNADLVTGTATRVTQDSQARGLITAVDPATATFTVLGQRVLLNGGTNFAVVPAVGAAVAVSGYRNGAQDLVASFVGATAAADDRLIGRVSAVNPGALEFSIGTQRVSYAQVAVMGGLPEVGDYLEVRGPRTLGGAWLANEVYARSATLGGLPGSGGSVEGYVVGAPVAAGAGLVFVLDGQVVRTSAATGYLDGTVADVAANAKLQVEGVFAADGALEAQDITIKRENGAGLFGRVQAVDAAAGTLQVSGVKVRLAAGARVEDKSSLRLPRFSLAQLAVGDTVEIDGYETLKRDGVGAERLRREERSAVVRLNGVVAGVTPRVVRLLGTGVVLAATTQYRGLRGEPISQPQFIALAPGRGIEVTARTGARGLVATEVSVAP